MAYQQYLSLNGISLPLPDSYEVGLEDVEADSSGETEAGTTQRDLLRSGVRSIPVSFSVSAKRLKSLTEFMQMEKLNVQFWNPQTLTMEGAEMFITDFKVKLVKDTSYGGLWQVDFTLKEF